MTENAYLVGLRLAGKKVVVIGGGTVAPAPDSAAAGQRADVHVITRVATPAVEAMARPDGAGQVPGITLSLARLPRR